MRYGLGFLKMTLKIVSNESLSRETAKYISIYRKPLVLNYFTIYSKACGKFGMQIECI